MLTHRDEKASHHRNLIYNRQRSPENCHLQFIITCSYRLLQDYQ